MLRWAFAIYMMLVTAAGPGLCCCSLTHLFAAHADRPAVPAAPADLPPCCQHTSAGQDHQGQGGCPREKQGDDRHKPGCPCRQVEAKLAALPEQAVELPDQSQFVSPFSVPYLAAALDGHIAPSVSAAWPGGPPPFLTADDLLHVHHQLRC
jgi:hypothetical protein